MDNTDLGMIAFFCSAALSAVAYLVQRRDPTYRTLATLIVGAFVLLVGLASVWRDVP